MPRPPAAREKILEAYRDLLRRDGERGATMDATAQLAGVSKGGLLYHFKSKDALADGVVQRLLEIVDEDLVSMATSAEGPSRHFVRSSVLVGTELDAYFAAVVRLASANHEPAREALERVHGQWLGLIADEVGDPHAAAAIMLIGEGLYYHAIMPGAEDPQSSASRFGGSMEQLLLQVDRLKAG
ncbi:TetR/AcrR family transcriptional regulator [Zafaria sp. Z1313]|uniref:TetR/AcrR family transcriptional regulator n=1 Tax=unclassified Zafaria TaxID=2828765 RepID=UPI002E76B770|nr:TetR/AcrR family transcriptional regulator [Zafaria sp. J156]MEE1621549.1 TetR/AcrR family transcriptional regulator [Zafaria sp. J156]